MRLRTPYENSPRRVHHNRHRDEDQNQQDDGGATDDAPEFIKRIHALPHPVKAGPTDGHPDDGHKQEKGDVAAATDAT